MQKQGLGTVREREILVNLVLRVTAWHFDDDVVVAAYSRYDITFFILTSHDMRFSQQLSCCES